MTNINDFGVGSLRRAIVDSNASPGANVISFGIPGTGLHVIRPTTALPVIKNSVIIDGDSQPGSVPNTLAQGDNATLMIVLDGSGIPDATHGLGLEIKADNSLVRGLAIENFAGVGVLFVGSGDHLEGSFIGVDPTGKVSQPNGLGVGVFGGGGVIGGTAPAARNVISGNTAGVGIASLALGTTTLLSPTSGSVVRNNLIGTDATGTGDLGNAAVGVVVVGSGNVVGGTGPGEANTIAFNGKTGAAVNPGAGVVVGSLQQTADAPISLVSTGDLISGNAIYSNSTLGIALLNVPATAVLPLLDLSSADLPSVISGLLVNLHLGVSPNVHLRAASGPNNFENFPDLASAVTAAGATTIRGTLDGTPRASYRIQFFASPTSDASGYGEGRTFLGEATVTAGADGLAPIVFSPAAVVGLGQVIAATAIDPGNNTSEFSKALTVTDSAATSAPVPPAPVPRSPSPAPVGSSPTPVVPSPAIDTRGAHRVHGHPIALLGETTNLVTSDHKGGVHITGNGRLAKLGKVTLESAVSSQNERPLLVTPWLLHADVVLTSPRGQVDVRISPGTIGLNPFAQPVHLKYSIQGGTGAFRHAAGTGLVDLRLFQSIPTNAGELKQMGIQLKTTGIRFTLTFHPGHLNKWGDFSSVWYKVIQTATKAHGHGHNHPQARTGSVKRA